jgi:SAM-dependent methyltransferase
MTESPLAANRGATLTAALERAVELLDGPLAPEIALVDGYLDLLGRDDPTGSHPGQRLMLNRGLSRIYQRLWRPMGAHLLMGLRGPNAEEEHRMTLAMLAVGPGDRVLDVGCGPGNFTRDFGAAAGEGLAVGVDASASMLAVAARDNGGSNIAYIRGDARELPFRDACFDAVCCYAALYFIEEPMRALAELVRVLAPGGRLALLATCERGPSSLLGMDAVSRGLTGARVFGRDELTGALGDAGLIQVEQRVTGLAQFVSARKPG